MPQNLFNNLYNKKYLYIINNIITFNNLVFKILICYNIVIIRSVYISFVFLICLEVTKILIINFHCYIQHPN